MGHFWLGFLVYKRLIDGANDVLDREKESETVGLCKARQWHGVQTASSFPSLLAVIRSIIIAIAKMPDRHKLCKKAKERGKLIYGSVDGLSCHFAPTAMCQYLLYYNRCGCYGPLVAGDSCDIIIEQLNRINELESWVGEGINDLPFDFPEDCLPNWHNTTIISSGVFCPGYFNDCPATRDPNHPYG
uniref:Uncharacterized protein n=1 Tax=Bionectria ochroleuca TaxID=29856 RepID=A0A0B7JY03_BIOOC